MGDCTPLLRMIAEQLVDEWLAEVVARPVAEPRTEAQNPPRQTADSLHANESDATS